MIFFKICWQLKWTFLFGGSYSLARFKSDLSNPVELNKRLHFE
ncbi:hypothetical protein C4K34_2246 [Pseudomonas chlororaphis subsp. piscium]|nr:hypothetical protein C4K34_2246 [Pseudomonas chlororaphis subsp. piscium]